MTESLDAPQRVAVDRLLTAFDLFEFGCEVMRQNLRRQHPRASEAEVEQRLGEWLQKRPGAEHGDGLGRVMPLPEELRDPAA
jgi:hypothetical protein